jgi:hypothetical protein
MQKATRYAIVAAIVLLVLLIAGFVLAAVFGVLLDVLYIALIILAFFALVSTAMLIYALLMLIRTITTARNEMKPLIASVQHTVGSLSASVEETTGAVKETAKIASQTATTIGSTARLTTESFVGPGIRAVALLVGGQQMFRVFFGKGRARRRYDERKQEQTELIELNSTGGGE